jgi:hypothetical protein
LARLHAGIHFASAIMKDAGKSCNSDSIAHYCSRRSLDKPILSARSPLFGETPGGMVMQFNLFAWIREGVRQSVLMGVTDAIENIGTPVGTEDVTPHLKAMMAPRNLDALPSLQRTVNEAAPRKRLGRSLKDIDMPGKPAME